MTEPAGIEPPVRQLQVLTGAQRAMLAQGAVPEPTEQQWRELSEFAEQHGAENGVDFAWISAGRLLMDHYEATLADVRRAYMVALEHRRLAGADVGRRPWWRRMLGRWSR